MKRGTPDHPKVLMLANRLKIPRYAAVGLLEMLWQFAARYASAGDIGRYSNEMIAMKLDWDGDAALLIEALIKERWLDRSNQYRLIVHDWSEHSDDAADKHLINNGLTYADGMLPRRGKNGGKAKKTGRARQVEKSLASSQTSQEKSGLEPDKSGKVEPLIPIPIPIPIPTPIEGESGGDLKDISDGLNEGEGDEAHRILKGRPELSMLTWEQDFTARKDFAAAPVFAQGATPGTPAGIDWLKVAEAVAERAILAGTIAQAGSWLRAQYDRVIRGMYPDMFLEKKTTAEDPRMRMFKAERD